MFRLLKILFSGFLLLFITTTTVSAMQLQISIDFRQEGDKTIFFGKTNLPEGTKIGVSLLKNRIIRVEDFKIVVKDGRFESNGFRERLVGKFELQLFTYFNTFWQKPEILEKISKYTGPAIKNGEMHITKKILIKPSEPLPANIKSEINDLKGYLEKLKASKGELEGESKKNGDWDKWSRGWNIRLRQERDNFNRRFGETFREYKGGCGNAYYFIGVGLGDLFSLWNEYDKIVTGGTISRELLRTQQALIKKDIQKAQAAMNECSE